MVFSANSARYNSMSYRRCGNSGIKLPAVSLGMWHNFGDENVFVNCREMILGAFDLGITHFDLANNYGDGSAEENFGRILSIELKPYRDELLISTKAGFPMWEGPYGNWGSKKYLISSLEQSLKRLQLDYVDIFYHHRPDPDTPMEETAEALEQMVRQGKALYVGISNYNAEQSEAMIKILAAKGIHCLVNQMNYSMLQRENESVLEVTEKQQIGTIAYCPLAQGLLTDKYLKGIPADSRAAKNTSLDKNSITPEKLSEISALKEIAEARGQSLAQMALAWVLCRTTSVIIGASSLSQIQENLMALNGLQFSPEELISIDKILREHP